MSRQVGRPRQTLTGARFGRLTVEGPAPDFADKGGHNVAWQMRCHCGVSFVARAHNIKRYHTRSCGCARRAK